MGSRASHGPWHSSSQASIVIWRPQRMGGGLTAEISLEAREKTDRTKDTRGLAWWWMQGHWLSVPDFVTPGQTLPLAGNWQWPQEIYQTRTDALGTASMTLTQFSVSPNSLAPHSLATGRSFCQENLEPDSFHTTRKIFSLCQISQELLFKYGLLYKYLHYRFAQFNSPWVQARVESFQLKVMLVWSSFTMLMFL